MVIALLRAGANQAPLVALLTARSLIAVSRTLLFDAPVMGARFTLGRITVSLPLPFLAGYLAALIQ